MRVLFKMGVKRGLFLLSIAGLFILMGCSLFFPGIEVEVELPLSLWEEKGLRGKWVLVYPDIAGGVRSRMLAEGVRVTEITLPRGVNLPVIGYPLGRLKPWGAFLDHSVPGFRLSKRVELVLEEEWGASAEMLLSLWDRRDLCETVNVELLQEALLRKGEGDPWSCDLRRIRHAVVTGSLNYLQIRKLPVTEQTLKLQAGDWVPETGFWMGDLNYPEEGEEGLFQVHFEGLYRGCTRFYSPEEGLELHVYVDADGDCRWVSAAPAVFAGRLIRE